MFVAIEPVGALDANFQTGTYEVISAPSSQSLTLDWSGSDATSTTDYQSGARVPSDPSRFLNGVYFSKAPLQNTTVQQPEAVPFVNYFLVGAPDRQILRIVPLQNYLFVFKEDGIFVISPTGDAAYPYRVDPLDLTVITYSPDSVQAVGGRIYALTNQGVVEVTSSGVRVVSDEIEDDLFQYFGPTLTQTNSLRKFAFGVSHETDRLYSLWVPPLNSNTNDPATAPYDKIRAYVYSTRARAWTNWELERTCGLVRPYDDALLMGGGSVLEPVVYKQRNTKTSFDFADEATDLTVVEYNGNTKSLTVSSTTGVSAGDAVSGDASTIVLSVDSATELTLSGNPEPTPTTTTLTVGIGGSSVNFTSGVTIPLTATALVDAINADAGLPVTAVESSPYANMTAKVAGAAGNAIAIDGNPFVGTFDSTLTGGADATFEVYRITLNQDEIDPDNGCGIGIILYYPDGFGGYIGNEWVAIGAKGASAHESAVNLKNDFDNLISLSLPGWLNASMSLDGDDLLLSATVAGPDGITGIAANGIGGPSGPPWDTVTDNISIISVRVGTSVSLEQSGEAATFASGTFYVSSLPSAVTAYKSIPIDIEWRTVSGGAPANMRTSREVHLHSRLRQFYKATLAFASELVTSEVTQDIYPGRQVDGTIPDYTPSTSTYPGRPVRPKKLRVGLPQDIARGAYFDFCFRISEAFALWTLNGFTLVDAAVSEKGQR